MLYDALHHINFMEFRMWQFNYTFIFAITSISDAQFWVRQKVTTGAKKKQIFTAWRRTTLDAVLIKSIQHKYK